LLKRERVKRRRRPRDGSVAHIGETLEFVASLNEIVYEVVC
jgi:hypothetical protein